MHLHTSVCRHDYMDRLLIVFLLFPDLHGTSAPGLRGAWLAGRTTPHTGYQPYYLERSASIKMGADPNGTLAIQDAAESFPEEVAVSPAASADSPMHGRRETDADYAYLTPYESPSNYGARSGSRRASRTRSEAQQISLMVSIAPEPRRKMKARTEANIGFTRFARTGRN